jgi:hypothetical protein
LTALFFLRYVFLLRRIRVNGQKVKVNLPAAGRDTRLVNRLSYWSLKSFNRNPLTLSETGFLTLTFYFPFIKVALENLVLWTGMKSASAQGKKGDLI